MVEHKDSFIEYLTSRRTVKSRLKSKTAREYVSYLESAAHALSIVIRPSSLSPQTGRLGQRRWTRSVDHVLIVPERIIRSCKRRVLLFCFQLVTGGEP